jgi:ABC-2 type transport system permease protein
MRRILAVARKEFRQVGRDPLTLIMLLGIPAFLLLLYGYALNFDVRNVALAVQDRSRTAESRDLIASFVHSTYFKLEASLSADADFHVLLQERGAQAILVIPEEYARRLKSGRDSPVQVIIDGTNAGTAATISGYIQGIAAEVNGEFVVQWYKALNRTFVPPIRFAPRVWYNPELKSTQFLVPGLIAFIMMITAVLSTAMSIVREKERGTMEQLRVTPLRPIQLILGKTIPYLVISLAAMAIILVVARLLFDVRIRGSLIDLFGATLLFLIGALGLGLLISTISRTQAMAWQLGSLISMLPTIFLSGFIFPIRNMPPVLQGLTYLFPARYFLVVMRGVILKGATLTPYLNQLAFLGIFAVLVLGVSYKRITRDLG